MADQQQEWWKDTHRESTTKRRSTPDDDNGGYNTDSSNNGESPPANESPYDTSPYDTSTNPSANDTPTYDDTGDQDPETNGEPTPEESGGTDEDPYNTSPYDTDNDEDPEEEPEELEDADEEDLDDDALGDAEDDANNDLPDDDDEQASESPADDADSADSDQTGDESGNQGSTPAPAIDGMGDTTSVPGDSPGSGVMGESALPMGMSSAAPDGLTEPSGDFMSQPRTRDDVDNDLNDYFDPIPTGEEPDAGTSEPGFESEMASGIDDAGSDASTVLPEMDESAFSSVPSDDAMGAVGASSSGGGSGGVAAIAGVASSSDSFSMDDLEEAGEEYVKEEAKRQVVTFLLANIWWVLGILAVILLISGVILASSINNLQRMYVEEDSVATEGGPEVGLDFTNHHLNADVLALQVPVEAAVKKHGISDSWVFIVLGMIQQETGGNVKAYPDVMQSSESQGWAPNTITDPAESIDYGVLALKNAINSAAANNITDVRAILQGYNMGHAILSWMPKHGHDHWTSDMAELYSMTIVYPAVTGSSSPATAANRETSSSIWAVSIGKPYYIRNGGDFHYPNAILHHLGVDYSGDGPIALEGVNNGMITEGSLSGYTYPIPIGKYQITSEFGLRNVSIGSTNHKGIDMQYSGIMFHKGGPIFAAADGKVLTAGFSTSMGNYVKIDHGPPGKNDAGLDPKVSITTTYMHMISLPSVQTGMTIKAGTLLGNEGTTGSSQAEHLHFQMEQNGVPFNPRQVYKFTPKVG